MLKRLVAGAFAAGVAAGLVAVLLQFAFVQSLLLEAETYESGARMHFAMPDGHAHGADTGSGEHAHDGGHADGHASGTVGRDALSVLFSIFTYVGFALVLVAAVEVAEARGVAIDARRGLIWGLAGFAIFHFAPALGLPPELPGNASADLAARQTWWLLTAAATAVALALFAFARGWGFRLAGAVLVLLPHLIGAPHPAEYLGSAPPELAAAFAVRALAASLGAWLVLGLVAGYVWRRMPEDETGGA